MEGATPVASDKSSHSPLLCLDWSVHDENVLALGSAAGAMKVIDIRAMGSGEQKGIVWRTQSQSISSPVRQVKFSPLLPAYFASAGDDGIVRIWDLRKSNSAVFQLPQLQHSLTHFAWSRLHCEIFSVGSSGGTLRISSLRNKPHHHLATYGADSFDFSSSSSTFTHTPISGTVFLHTNPPRILSATAGGVVSVHTLTASFLTPHATAASSLFDKFSDQEDIEDVQSYFFLRDFSQGAALAVQAVKRMFLAKKFEEANEVISICSAFLEEKKKSSRDTIAVPQGAGFLEEIDFYSVNIPKNFPLHLLRRPNETTIGELELLRMQLGLVLAAHRQDMDMLSPHLATLPKKLTTETNNMWPTAIVEILRCVLGHDVKLAFSLALELLPLLFQEREKDRISTQLLHEFCLMFFSPTIIAYSGPEQTLKAKSEKMLGEFLASQENVMANMRLCSSVFSLVCDTSGVTSLHALTENQVRLTNFPSSVLAIESLLALRYSLSAFASHSLIPLSYVLLRIHLNYLANEKSYDQALFVISAASAALVGLDAVPALREFADVAVLPQLDADINAALDSLKLADGDRVVLALCSLAAYSASALASTAPLPVGVSPMVSTALGLFSGLLPTMFTPSNAHQADNEELAVVLAGKITALSELHRISVTGIPAVAQILHVLTGR
eukprot:TRINITY_DN3041_c0_g1_i2.p1 TRINITY_DN3041_c0_g1~~TRINITY_DN3041_c0_g1_i2.p1  ORF type:complete len:670 (-),score=158.93 TRINITY_DN3041_c0_g1_i2:8-2017(-)